MKYGFKAAALAASTLLAAAPALADAPQHLTPEQQAELAKLKALAASLRPVSGDVQPSGSNATLSLRTSYYYLNADDAKRVLTQAWRNPPDSVSGVLGMVFPQGTNFTNAPWAAVVTYVPSGFVSDVDAKTTDYGKLLEQLRSGEDQENQERAKQNLPQMHLVGWAQQPSYDPVRHSLVWARDIKVAGESDDTLNYDVRELGRKGVLSLNIVSQMSMLPTVRTAAQSLAGVASFQSGGGYTDYKDGVDKKAAYGVAGLIAAGAGVALAQKFGLLALLILGLKKFAVVIIAGAAGLFARFRNMFGGKKKPAA